MNELINRANPRGAFPPKNLAQLERSQQSSKQFIKVFWITPHMKGETFRILMYWTILQEMERLWEEEKGIQNDHCAKEDDICRCC